MISYYHDKHPAFKHDCEKCKFIISIRREDGFTIDLYKSCPGSFNEYLIRTGNNPEDYSTPSIESMAICYAEIMENKVIDRTKTLYYIQRNGIYNQGIFGIYINDYETALNECKQLALNDEDDYHSWAVIKVPANKNLTYLDIQDYKYQYKEKHIGSIVLFETNKQIELNKQK